MMEMLGDHLWQSTICAAAIALLAPAFRRNRAHVRHWLWLGASLKFLVPFAALIALGNQIGWPQELAAVPELTLAVSAVSQPFSRPDGDLLTPAASPAGAPAGPALGSVLAGAWALGSTVMLALWVLRWTRVAAVARAGTVLTDGREVAMLRRLERTAGLRRRIALVATDGSLEPGVFGIVRPRLLWPRSIGDRLGDAQAEAIIAHEVIHVRRRDNLASAGHMVVQAIFWFHPLVWWLSARLVDERERACDEEVIRLGSAPGAYAEGILETIRYYVESPLICVSGVTGADLEKRIEQIMRNEIGVGLNASRKTLLAMAAAAVVAGPLAVGVMSAPQLTAPSTPITADTPRFAVASVKANTSGQSGSLSRNLPGGAFQAANVPLFRLILNAYGLQPPQVIGGPEWINRGGFDIDAKSDGTPTPAQASVMMRALLSDRFMLRTHTETREIPVYGIVLARRDGRLGPALTPTPEGDCVKPHETSTALPPPPPPPPLPPPGGRGAPQGATPCGSLRFGPGSLVAKGTDITQLARSLSGLPVLTGIERIVLDRTGLTGKYDFEVKWNWQPPAGAPGATGALAGPDEDVSIFTALQEQLGLKLEPQRAPVEVLVVDSAQPPTEN